MTKITCNLCQKNFERQDSYKRHLRSAGHKNIAQAKFKCNICNLSYRQAAGLSRHKRKCREKQLAEKEKENDELKKQLALMKAEAKVADAAAAAAATAAAKEIENYELKKQIAELKAAAAAIPSAAPANVHFATMPIKTYLRDYCGEAKPFFDVMSSLDLKKVLKSTESVAAVKQALHSEVERTLRSLDIPSIICTDAKRNRFYVMTSTRGWVDDTTHSIIDLALNMARIRQYTAFRKLRYEKMSDKEQVRVGDDFLQCVHHEQPYRPKLKKMIGIVTDWKSYRKRLAE
tara:strand:- start:26 stop:892 length:867 start_codon:yes stop_codon:yes gene_type:complete